MLAARRLLAQRNFALILCTMTLLLKLLVPTGYMVGGEHGRVTIELCSGLISPPMAMKMARMGAMPEHGHSKHGGRVEMPCAFSGLSAASLAATDPLQLATLIVFIMAGGLSPAVLPAPASRSHLRPPLRGPPAHP